MYPMPVSITSFKRIIALEQSPAPEQNCKPSVCHPARGRDSEGRCHFIHPLLLSRPKS